MKARAIRSVLIGFLGVALALASGSASAIAFRITDPGTLSGGQDTDGTDLNASGQATGFSRAGAAFLPHAFLWDGTTMQDLGTLGGSASFGNDINDAGQVTGRADTADVHRCRAEAHRQRRVNADRIPTFC